jgi:hypothetical protein
MHRFSRFALAGLLAAAMTSACAPAEQPATNNTNATVNTNASTAVQTLTVASAPERIEAMRKERGAQEQAAPTIKIVEPANGSTINGDTVRLRLDLGGDLKGYAPGKDPHTGMGNHIHVILDNQPYEAYYSPNTPFELRNLSPGKHTIRVFPSRPWHESYKNDGAFQMVEFTVAGGAASGNANTNAAPATNMNTNAEGKDYSASTAGNVDVTKPLLTYSRPKGEYKGDDADPIMLDFWLANAKLKGDGGQYRIRYSVDGGAPQFVDTWAPIWLSGWTAGKHTVKLELVDEAGNVVDNGGYNSTSREITVVK